MLYCMAEVKYPLKLALRWNRFEVGRNLAIGPVDREKLPELFDSSVSNEAAAHGNYL